MKSKRLWWSIRTALTRGGSRRADYARKNSIYAHVGKNVSIQSRVIPLYSELICFHDNIAVARNVDFCTHDVMHVIFNRMKPQMAVTDNLTENGGGVPTIPFF